MATYISRTDPINNAGLFVGPRRRPAVAAGRSDADAKPSFLARCGDECLALVALVVEVALVISVWTAQPVGWVWVASQVSYLSGSAALALVAGLGGMILGLVVTLAVLTRVDHGWKLARRAAGREQKEGVLEPLFMGAFVLFVPAFLVWFFVFEGPGSMVYPARPG
jgi:hypothetical protein